MEVLKTEIKHNESNVSLGTRLVKGEDTANSDTPTQCLSLMPLYATETTEPSQVESTT